MNCCKLFTLIAGSLIIVGCGPMDSDPGASGGGGAGKPVVVNDANFEQVVLKSDKPVLVDFWAEWCGPCKAIAPWVEEVAEEYDGRAVVAKLDIDDSRDVAVEYNIESIPTLIVFKDGKEFSRVVGLESKAVLTGKLDAALE